MAADEGQSFEDWLKFCIQSARYVPDALDPKAAEILENVLFRYKDFAPKPQAAAICSRHHNPYCNECVEAYKRNSSAATPQAESRDAGAVEIPADIAEIVLSIGEAEWGQTPEHDADGHAGHIRESVHLTAEYFGQTEPQRMQGLYIKGTGTVICHTGTSPNSGQIARALTGAWNHLRSLAALKGTPTDAEG